MCPIAQKAAAHFVETSAIGTDRMDDSAMMNMWLHKTVLPKIAANGGNTPKVLTHGFRRAGWPAVLMERSFHPANALTL